MTSMTPKRLLASLAVVGAAAAVAGLGTFATFTSSTSASHTVSSGTVSIALGASGAANRLNIGASNLVPGDTVQRAADLNNNGTGTADNLSSIALTTTASPSSLLDTETSNGLQMTIDKCTVAWTESASPYTYTCGGTTSTVLASRPVIGSAVALASLSSLSTGSTDHLRVTLALPTAATNAMQGQTSTVSYNFLGTQRVAGNK